MVPMGTKQCVHQVNGMVRLAPGMVAMKDNIEEIYMKEMKGDQAVAK